MPLIVTAGVEVINMTNVMLLLIQVLNYTNIIILSFINTLQQRSLASVRTGAFLATFYFCGGGGGGGVIKGERGAFEIVWRASRDTPLVFL